MLFFKHNQNHNNMTKSLVTIIAILFSVLFSSQSFSANTVKILFIADTSHSYHKFIIADTQRYLESSNFEFSTVNKNEYTTIDTEQYNLLITIGYEAARAFISNKTRKPVLSLLIPDNIFNQLLSENVSRVNQKYFSSIYINQPTYRNINLIREISSKFKTIGVLLGRQSANQLTDIETTIRNKNLKSHIIDVRDKTRLIQETRIVSKTSDILLAIPDNTIYNKRSIKGILLTTYRNRIPVIGYSKNYVKAGALAAVYSDEEQISRHAAEIIRQLNTNSFGTFIRTHPRYFSVATNSKVAYSLNIKIPDKSILEKKLNRKENN